MAKWKDGNIEDNPLWKFEQAVRQNASRYGVDSSAYTSNPEVSYRFDQNSYNRMVSGLGQKTSQIYDSVAPSSSGRLSSGGGSSGSNFSSGDYYSPNALADAFSTQDSINYGRSQDLVSWQERMSNTAHQREVADLKAAGLNPVLSAGGSGASTPSGTTYYNQAADRKLAIFQSLLGAETAVKQSQIAAGATLGAANIGAAASTRNAAINAFGNSIGSLFRLANPASRATNFIKNFY